MLKVKDNTKYSTTTGNVFLTRINITDNVPSVMCAER